MSPGAAGSADWPCKQPSEAKGLHAGRAFAAIHQRSVLALRPLVSQGSESTQEKSVLGNVLENTRQSTARTVHQRYQPASLEYAGTLAGHRGL